MDPERVMQLLLQHANTPEPDVMVVLDVPLQVALQRRGAASDRIEAKGDAFHAKVIEGYRVWAQRHARTRLVDATSSPEVVHAAVWKAVSDAR
jgi:thymidylate kinase